MKRRQHSPISRSWRWLMLAAMLILADPRSAGAHASLTASEPADQATLARAPDVLTLTFSEPVEPLGARLIDASGAAVAIGGIQQRGDSLVLTPPARLGDGVHVLSWRVVSADGHPVGGSLTFWIGQRAGLLPAITVNDNVPRHAAIWIARLLVYLALFASAGGAFFLVWIGEGPSPSPARRTVVAMSLIGLIAVAASIGLQGLEVADLPLSDLVRPASFAAGAGGSFGRAALIAVLALGFGLLSLRMQGLAARVSSLAALVAAGLSFAASGHAANASPRALAFASVWLHGVAAACWIGALLPLGLWLGAGTDAAWITLLRFSRTIPFAVAVLILSGVILAVMQLAAWDALWTTAYGRILCAKLLLVLLLLGIAGWNRLVLTPQIAAGSEPARHRVRQAIGAEIVLAIVLLGVVGLWRFTPPPRALAPAIASFFTHLHTERVMANVTLSPMQGGMLEIAVQLETPQETPLLAKALSVTLANPAIGIEPASVDAQDLGNGQWRARMPAAVPGRWTLGLGILISDFERIAVEAPVLIR